MSVHTVAILSPGDMGSGVGFALGQNDIDVITCLRGRSNRTRQLAAEAHFRDIPTLGLLVEQADLILSILCSRPSGYGCPAGRCSNALLRQARGICRMQRCLPANHSQDRIDHHGGGGSICGWRHNRRLTHSWNASSLLRVRRTYGCRGGIGR